MPDTRMEIAVRKLHELPARIAKHCMQQTGKTQCCHGTDTAPPRILSGVIEKSTVGSVRNVSATSPTYGYPSTAHAEELWHKNVLTSLTLRKAASVTGYFLPETIFSHRCHAKSQRLLDRLWFGDCRVHFPGFIVIK